MTAAKKPQPSFWDQPWPYGYVSRPIMWAVTVWGVAVAAYAVHLETWTLVLAGIALAILAPIAVPARYRLFAFILGAAVGTYVTWAAGQDPIGRDPLLMLIPGAGVFGVWWHVLGKLRDIEAELKAEEEAKVQKAIEEGNLPVILANAGFKGIEPAGPVEKIAAGTMQRLLLPANGSIDFKRLHAATGKIMIAARAKYPIRFTPGSHQAEVVAIQLDRDVLAETLPYPIDRAPRSIHDPVPLGKDEMGDVKVVTFRELSAMFVGERGSGKSGLINSHLAYLTGCTDALIWMIDGKGGRTARPWLQPFLDGIGKPALDWCAITTQEADYMLLAARAVIDARSKGKGEKVYPTAAQPAIILIVEEASLITGTGDGANAQRAQLGKQNVVLGRSEAVDLVLVAQRGTVTMLGSGDMKSQLQYIVGLGISKLEDAVRIFGDSTLGREALRFAGDLAYRGVMLVKAPGWKSVLPVKGWWLDPDLIPGVAQTNALHRPDLEQTAVDRVEAELEHAGCPGGYAGRWDRFAKALDLDARELAGATQAGSPAPTAPPAGGSGNGSGETRAERLVREAKERVREQSRVTQERAEFERIMGREFPQNGSPSGSPDGSQNGSPQAGSGSPDGSPSESENGSPELTYNPEVIPPVLGCLMAVFTALGDDLVPTQVILEQPVFESLSAKRLGLLMGHCGVAVRNNVPYGDKRVNGYARIDIEKAFTRARDTGAPEAAFDWRP